MSRLVKLALPFTPTIDTYLTCPVVTSLSTILSKARVGPCRRFGPGPACPHLGITRRQAEGGEMSGCVVQTERGSQVRRRKFVHAVNRHCTVGSMGHVGATRRQSRRGVVLRAAAEERPQPRVAEHPRRAADRDRDLDRREAPPPSSTGCSRPRPIEYELRSSPRPQLRRALNFASPRTTSLKWGTVSAGPKSLSGGADVVVPADLVSPVSHRTSISRNEVGR